MISFNIPIITALIIISIGSLVALSYFLQKRVNATDIAKVNNHMRAWLGTLGHAITKPLLLILISYAVYFSVLIITNSISLSDQGLLLINLLDKLTSVILVLGLFWFIIRLINAITGESYKWASENNSRIGIIIFPLINNSLKAIATLILINILLPYLAIPDAYLPIAEKSATLLLIAAITWIILQVINAGEQYFLHRYGLQITENLKSRKIYTQITVLKKIAISIVITVAIAIALMTFERVRELGATLLASAGIIAAIGAFAAQKTLSSTFAGLQIALTQPIKINDAVIVENEFGTVEEITLNYVVIKIWDLRRLVVPINYFIEKPFQNWTRHSSNLIGAIMLYFDYSLPVEDLRHKFYEILEHSPLWDRNVKNLQVTDAKEHTIEIRLLVSAADAGKVFDLRCEVREKIIAYIREKYPHCLPRMRIDSDAITKLENMRDASVRA
jgi:small-conductance mechanosensitive channel